MIVRYNKNGWEVTTQRAHGLLAAQLAFHWRVKNRPARWVETLLAIAEHDDAETELDGENLITPAGGPLDYSMKKFDKTICGRLAMRTLIKSRYIALLVCRHMDFLYRDEAKVNVEARGFLEHHEKVRKSIQGDLGISDKKIEKAYSLLEWCDAFSLLICQEAIPLEQRKTEISTGPDKKRYKVFHLKEDILCVTPWPFEEQSFEVCFERRCIGQLAFKDSDEFRTVFKEAAVQEVRWIIQGKPARYKKRKK